jgi:hypothetical protein
MAELIAVTSRTTGFGPRLRYALVRMWGAKPCALLALSHGIVKPSTSWAEFATRLHHEFGHTLTVVYKNRADDTISRASTGRQPCVLIRDADGGVSMIADWNDLSAASGNVATFEKILRSKLLMY